MARSRNKSLSKVNTYYVVCYPKSIRLVICYQQKLCCSAGFFSSHNDRKIHSEFVNPKIINMLQNLNSDMSKMDTFEFMEGVQEVLGVGKEFYFVR